MFVLFIDVCPICNTILNETFTDAQPVRIRKTCSYCNRSWISKNEWTDIFKIRLSEKDFDEEK